MGHKSSSSPNGDRTSAAGWVAWALGGALLTVVIVAALHFSEQREFIEIAQRAEPSWLLAALLLQTTTYIAQGEIWRSVVAACGYTVSRPIAFELSLAKLFADQALPSAGFSSGVLVAKALAGRGLPAHAVTATVIVNLASYYLAYLPALFVALAFATSRGQSNVLITATAALFGLFAAAFSAAVLFLAGRRYVRLDQALRRLPIAKKSLDFVAGADGRLVRSGALLTRTVAFQVAIILLDATTMWVLIEALGAHASPMGVFASFMISSLFRTVGVMPGGLGTFEATSVLTLRMVGIDLAVALSATLLFRGLSFWLPMVPGYWFSLRLARSKPVSTLENAAVAYWSLERDELVRLLGSSASGLSREEAEHRLRVHGPNVLRESRALSRLRVLGRQLRSPLLLLLTFAAAASALTGEWIDATLVLTIVLATAAIGYSREYSAQAAAEALRARLRARASVLRDGVAREIPIEAVVPGDVVLLSAGSIVPADAVLLEATDFFVSEAMLTGESFPVDKAPGVLDPSTAVARRTNCVFLGTNVRSGTASCLVVGVGAATQFDHIARRLVLRPPETEFDRGVRRFGYLLTSAMSIMVLLVFVAHVLLGEPAVETLLFSIALAVGLSPELLPAILSVNLARGAKLMAERGVLVRRLTAIENLGSMDVLCTDKTGTLTEGVVQLEGSYDALGRSSEAVLELGARNASLETGVASPLDEAITKAHSPDPAGARKLGEIPFDFIRKRITVVTEQSGRALLIVKGAFYHVLEICARTAEGVLDGARQQELERRYDEWTSRGIRVLAVATRTIDLKQSYDRGDERDMTFAGFLTFLDRPKEGVGDAIRELAALGVAVKLITGDSRRVAEHVGTLVGLPSERVLTGEQLDELHDEALWSIAERTDLFVEVDPNQKERIILSLKKMGHVVGFLGDGVNDVPAMHAADTSLSVEQAVDVAREAADFVLLERGLDVIRRGIEEGRKTFANTLKYVLITTSANLGNMVSMAAVSLFLPFLPLTAGQILLNNLLSDIPAVGIADDAVDSELVERPRRWDMRFIGRYMLEFGALSTVFDFLTFGTLIWWFEAQPPLFRTGWFVESLLTELLVALLMRTRRPFYRSRPGGVLLGVTMILIPIAFAIPYAPFVGIFGFVPMPGPLVATIAGIAVLYVAATEVQKRWFYRRMR